MKYIQGNQLDISRIDDCISVDTRETLLRWIAQANLTVSKSGRTEYGQAFHLIKQECDYKDGIDVEEYILNKGDNIDEYEEIILNEHFTIKNSIVATCHETKNMFSYVESREQLKDFMSIAG